MSTSVLPHRLRSPTALWRGLVAACLAFGRKRCRGGKPVLDTEVLHDIGLDREHQDYSSRGCSAHRSPRRMHARAERIAAGLPD